MFPPSLRRLPALPVIGATLLAAALPAFARLGETKEECIVRYGEPTASTGVLLQGAETLSFFKNNVRIRAEFLNNRAVFIQFMRPDMKSDTRDDLLEINKGDLSWDSPQDYMGRKFWLARTAGGDESRHANFYTISKLGVLELSLSPWVEGMKAQKAAMDAAVKEGRGTTSNLNTPAPGNGADKAAAEKPVTPAKGDGLDGF